MSYRASVCDPFNPKIIEIGEIPKDWILEKFNSISWNGFLTKMKSVNQNEIHYSPSFEVENIDNKNGICVSALDENDWMVFYKRPKKIKVFGLFEINRPNYTTTVERQTLDEVKKYISALIENNFEFLENKIK